MTSPILFLDFDGVLNGTDYLRKLPRSVAVSYTADLDPACCARLQRILDATDADVVISSSWREMLSLDLIRQTIADAGIKARVIDITPIRPYRHQEIEAWLEVYAHVKRWVALDDVALPGLEHNRVRTDERTGLTDEDVEKAIRILKGE